MHILRQAENRLSISVDNKMYNGYIKFRCFIFVAQNNHMHQFDCESCLLGHLFTFLFKWRPLVAMVAITAAKTGVS